MSTGINQDVRRLLEDSIDSIRKLDVLLCMRDAGAERSWTAAELNAKLRSSETALEADLSGLLDARLVESVAGPPTAWRYAPGPRTRTVDALAASYRTHRTAVIRVITTRGGSSAQQFADAFRIQRKEPQDG